MMKVKNCILDSTMNKRRTIPKNQEHRARVEDVFGFMKQSMNGLKLKSIGIVRATGIIG